MFKSLKTGLAIILTALVGFIVVAPAQALTLTETPLISRSLKIGAWSPTSPYNGGLDSLEALEYDLGRRMDIVNWFKHWGSAAGEFTYDQYGTLGQLQLASSEGRTPMITWMPMDVSDTFSSSQYMPSRIISGEYDSYIKSWADGLKTFNKPVYIRFAHEMNGDWYPWSSEGGSQYVAMWKHVVDIFRAKKVTNVKWVWAVNQIDAPSTNDLEAYYPGSDYVDVHGTDVYNCGWRGWQSFNDLASDSYNRMVALNPDKPVWVTELGTCEPANDVANSSGQTKADWFVDLFNTKGMPKLEAIVFFNQQSRYNWNLNTSAATQPTIRNVMRQMPNWTAPPAGTFIGNTLPAPANFKINREYTKAIISWDTVPNANGYVIKKDGNIIAYSRATSFTDTGLDKTQTYNYSVAAAGAGNISSYNGTDAVPNPILLNASSSGNHAYIKFNTTVGNSYNILQNGTLIKTITATATSTSFTVYTLDYLQKYSFQIKEVETANMSDVKYIITGPQAPVISNDGKMWAGKAVLNWKPVAGATSYKLYKNGHLIATLSSAVLTYTDATLSSNTSYEYSLRSMNTYVTSFMSNKLRIVTAPPPPNNVKATIINTRNIQILWDAVPNVKGYAVYRDGSYIPVKIVDSTMTSYVDEKASTAAYHYYNVRSIYDFNGENNYTVKSTNSNTVYL